VRLLQLLELRRSVQLRALLLLPLLLRHGC
jgi:hypothetical protein